MKESKMKMNRRTIATSAVAMFSLAVFVLASAVRAQVLEQVPDDAMMVIKIKSLSATSDKVGKLMTELGLAGMQPGMDNPLAMLQEHLGIKEGMQLDGEAAIVFRDPSITKEGGDKSMVLLIPVSNFDAFVGNFANAKTEGEIATVDMPMAAGPGYIAHWGKYAAMSPSKLVLQAAHANAVKITGSATKKELVDRDVVLFVNMARLRPQAQFVLGMARMQVENLDQMLPQEDLFIHLAPLMKAGAAQVMTVADAFVRDADAMTISLNIGSEGFNIAGMSDFKADSYSGQLVSSFASTDEPLVGHLPEGNYLMLGGYVNNPEVANKMMSEFLDPIMKEVDAAGADLKPAHDYCTALTDFLKTNRGASFGILSPKGQIGKDSLIQAITVHLGDPKVMKSANERMMQAQQEFMKALKLPGSDAFTVTVTPNAKTQDGVSFDAITSAANPNANDPASRRAQQATMFMYGPGGLQMLEGEAGGRYLVALGLDDETLSRAIAAAKSNDAPVASSKMVKSVAGNLPAKRMVEVYLPLGQIANTVLGYLGPMGAGLNVNIAADLPPIVASISTAGPAYRAETYVPTQLVKEMVQAGMNVMGKMHGNRGNPHAQPDKDSDKDDKDGDKGN